MKKSEARAALDEYIDVRRRTGGVTESWQSFESQRHYLNKIYSECRDVLKKYGCEEILRHSYNAYSVDVEKIPCDYCMSGKKPEDYIMQYGFWI